ncbi:glycosyltransferase [Solirubrobacter sp. CPCC 204708]|uniref:Glycosyltransferase n=1 Tax=Solirubrobacter deserti TaxID=2282478 RepID=A0ABT4RBQ5_9ACTN|nr:glycosyltransferase [Solirubrobacter deserti]MBE2317149.1 glycosyltransferase [Solirubrobacter deserti]MDA0135958.1 glycosyltransferase [Solirubrobacter deserti]
MARADVLIVSLGGTAGLREADAELAASLRRAGARVEVASTPRPPELRTFAAIELAWALNARRAAVLAIREHRPHAVLYSSSTAALLGPVPGAIRFDAPAAGNRPGRHGIWQRPVEARRFQAAPLLVPWSEGGLAEAPTPRAGAVIVPVPVEPSGPPETKDIAAITYGANPEKKGLDRVLAAWARDARPGEELVVAGLDEARGRAWLARAAEQVSGRGRATPLLAEHPPSSGEARFRERGVARLRPTTALEQVRFTGMIPRTEYRALLRRARVFVTAPRREDYGIAQLEALADGCVLVTNTAPGPYAALPIARALDPRLVGDRLDIRTALDDPRPGGRAAVAPFTRAAVDQVVAEELLPRLRS